jgi:D-alanine-D-alanine ligase
VAKLRIGVVYGGRSGEHEVSVASAAAVLAHLDRTRYEPVPIRIDRDGRWMLPDRPPVSASTLEVIEQARLDAARPVRPGREVFPVARPGQEALLTIDRRNGSASSGEGDERSLVHTLGLDVVFPVLHGPFGEDGTVQGLLELAGIPYVGAGVAASAVGMDKGLMKKVFEACGLPVADYMVVRVRDWRAQGPGLLAAIGERLGFPVFVKPANLGSSVGISKAKDPEHLRAALELAAQFDRRLVVERAVPAAREIECAVLGNDDPECSVPGEIVPGREFYDYEAKYLDASSALVIPAALTAAQASDVQRLAAEAFLAIDGAGMARVDFLLDGESGRLFVNEINTIPGFTTISMYAKLWEASGVGYGALLDRLIALALERHAERQQLRLSP